MKRAIAQFPVKKDPLFWRVPCDPLKPIFAK